MTQAGSRPEAVLDSYSDLPAALLKQLRAGPHRKRGMQWRIIEMLKESNKPLTIDEMLINDYRNSNKITTRQTIRTILSDLHQAGLVQRVKPGIYEFNKGAVT